MRGLLLDPDHWYVTSMGTVPIGNGLAVSPLQMLQVYVTLANGGMYKPPKLVDATIDSDGVRHPVEAEAPHRVVSEATAGKLVSMLTQVVQTGTGTNAAVPGYLAAGKTGTARKPLEGARGYSGNYVASFVGFVPAQDPRLAAVIVLDEPTPIYGGQVSAPVFARIMQYALRLERIPPPAVAPPAGAPGAGPTHALDEAPGNDDPNVPGAATTSTTKSASTTSTPRPTSRSTPTSTTTTTRPKSRTAAESPATTTTGKPAKSTTPTTASRSAPATSSSEGDADPPKGSGTLGPGEGRSSPAPGQSGR